MLHSWASWCFGICLFSLLSDPQSLRRVTHCHLYCSKLPSGVCESPCMEELGWVWLQAKPKNSWDKSWSIMMIENFQHNKSWKVHNDTIYIYIYTYGFWSPHTLLLMGPLAEHIMSLGGWGWSSLDSRQEALLRPNYPAPPPLYCIYCDWANPIQKRYSCSTVPGPGPLPCFTPFLVQEYPLS